ncbi:MAG: toprim domain-containing protein [Acidobacteria bacterium]|nr:toprim domain-containing protein [Acidobacteriota bacterium]
MVVVEGFFDTIAVHQAGYPTVGLMGSTLSRYQADLLTQHFKEAVLMLDGDDAGRQGATAIAETLSVRMRVSVVSLEDGQPDQLASGEIQRVLDESACRRRTL